jgi:hypothetical protein
MFRPSLWLAASLPLLALVPLHAADLSKYRAFEFGMSLETAAKLAQVEPSAARVIHQTPALIQTLEWRDYRSSGASDPVKFVLLSFYNDQLFRMVVYYDRSKTEGLTARDILDAISETYGAAATPVTGEALIPSLYSNSRNESAKVLARWEDPQYVDELVQLPDTRDFALLLVSRRLEALASAAVIEAERLDRQAAPQREIDLRKKEQEDSRALLEKARLANKPGFRP